MTDFEYHGSFEEELQKRKVKKFQYYPEHLGENYKPKDFSGNPIEDDDYQVWSEPY